MGFSLWSIFKTGLLFTNALLILNRRRFLARYGLDAVSPHESLSSTSLKSQAVGLLQAVGYLKVPVIACNVVVSIFELLLGGT